MLCLYESFRLILVADLMRKLGFGGGWLDGLALGVSIKKRHETPQIEKTKPNDCQDFCTFEEWKTQKKQNRVLSLTD